MLREIEFSELVKLTVPLPKAEDYATHGSVGHFDLRNERINPKSPVYDVSATNIFHLLRSLIRNWKGDWEPFVANASDDPVLHQIQKEKKATVFATDQVLATLMSSNRSFYSWDIYVRKEGNTIIFDKREGCVLGIPTKSACVLINI